TVKERHMWSCSLPNNQPVKLIFELPCEKNTIARINIWNYNKNISELNIGAKDVRILVDGKDRWCGEIDKGCGNQVFDYSKEISLECHELNRTFDCGDGPQQVISESCWLETPQKTKVTKETRENVLEMFGGKRSPTKGKEKPRRSRTPRKMAAQLSNQSSDSTSTSDSIHSSSESISRESPMPMENQLKYPTENPTRVSQENQLSIPKQSKSFTVAASPEEPSMLQQLLQLKSSTDATPRPKSQQKPTWLQSPEKELVDKVSSLDLSPLLKEEKRKDEDKAISRRTPYQEDWEANVVVVKPDSKTHIEGEALTTRAQWRQFQDVSLEESWNSLSLFNKSQRGRLSANMNTDLQGDALDSYLLKPKPAIQENIQEEEEDEVAVSDEDSDFEIPEQPFGQYIDVNIKSTWGDKHYVGLNGIEIFQSSGEPVKIAQITADPSDINILDGYANDPRVVTNLIDGVNRTRDDVHMWLAPFTPGNNHLIFITLEKPVKIAMIRIW
ncbi:protein KATNIP homolog, partial [Saccoglossus kowalevskii]|uniref:Uncharacterized protein KIAA0556 homolog n=1 Tax=Saccoglossus kowalevskii TaxID=10224 RepID=A0ABM0MR87_SACKO